MQKKAWRGSVAIPMTPYDEHDRIDENALVDEIRFCIGCGVGAIAAPMMVSEFRLLSEDERRLMIRAAVETCADTDVPVVANCAAVNTPLAAAYAAYAQEVGADAVIAMPPYVHKADFPTIYNYYKAISDAVTIPVWIQNASVTALSPEQILKLCTEMAHVSWIKEEVPPSTQRIGALVALNSPSIDGVLGGGGGRYLIAERARGAQGVVHACQFCDLVQRIWELLDEDNTQEAETLYERLLPSLMLEGLMGMAFAKEIMIRRGVLHNHRIRTRQKPLDSIDMAEIDRVWKRLEPHLIWGA